MSYIMVGAAAAGLLKGEVIDKPAADRQRKLAAETQRYSPWTGLKAQPVKEADPLGSAIAFGTAGAQISNGMQQQATNKKLADKALASDNTPVINYYGGQPSMPFGGGGQNQNYSIWDHMNSGG